MKLSPVRAMVIALLFCAAIQGLVIYVLLQQPWTGLRVEPDALSGAVRVVAVGDGSPVASSIPLGTLLVAVQIEGKPMALPLTPALFLSPFFSATHADYRAYLQAQSDIYLALREKKSIEAISSSGQHYPLRAVPMTPWRAIPVKTWVFSLLFMTVPILSVFVWSYQSKKFAPLLLLYAGIGYYLFYMIGTLNLAKELAFSGVLAEVLAVIEFAFLGIYIFSFTVLFSYYPNRLINKYWLYGFGAFLAFCVMNFHFGWMDFYGHNFLIPSFSAFGFSTALSQFQVNASKREPVSRMAARMMQMSIIFPFFPIMGLYVLPLLLGAEPIISIHVVRILGIAVFMGVAVGILRFRLFEAEYWWLRSWLWLVGGVLVVFIDILFVGVLHLTQVYSLGLSVLVAGFLYFPLRQWLMGKVMPLDSQSVQAFLPTFSTLMGSAVFRDEFEQRWQEALRIRFQPLHLSVQPHAVPLAALADNGLHLDVPSLSGVNSYRLTGKQMGMRLFGKNNLKTTTSLLDIARIASNASERRHQAVLTERTRIMHDLHDTVGAKLLTLSHMLPTAKHKQAAQESLQTLRDMINLTLQKSPLTLGESLADWRLEAMERAEAANVELRWQVAPALERLELRPGQTIELLLFVRATLQQMMASATLQQLTVQFSLAEKQLCVRITAPDNPLAAVTHTLNFT
ncbi:MAG: hypothetical protein BWK73_30555 [Thiothrix lacustris]|uniref:Signal transduction histidine kinase subgroup 3 dimerisation and phosphoacceptor domain-containing protein n=1 Tax=Thiothrix lacustris TaxID=525917 RepID=A0A1Y1QIK8_9GAMM|nr:MAG: hypothetical protein BWK73_30555 [Thiothrix lacustris]